MSNKLKFWQRGAFILVGIGLLAALYGYLAFVGMRLPWNVDRSDLASFGNFLQGAVGSLWSLAAFLFIYVAFLGQQEALEHSRTEAATQEETAAQQRFETTFFNLLGLHRSNLDAMHSRELGGEFVTGWKAFRGFYNALQSTWMHGGISGANDLEKIQAAYTSFFRSHESEIGHYFRTLYHIVRFVDQSTMRDQQKRDYEKFLRAQLSSMELLLLFYNGLSTYGYENFKPLIEKYALLEQVPKPQLLDPNHAKDDYLYKRGAFHD